MADFAISPSLYLAYVVACLAIIVVPGPTLMLIATNSLSHGRRAGLLNVAGTQLGLAMMIGVLIVGLVEIMALKGRWFDVLRGAGAVYLVWLGWKLISSSGVEQVGHAAVPRGGYFLQGLLVILSNPKALLFFGEFIPQFVDPKGHYEGQLVLLGLTFIVLDTLLYGLYAVLLARAGLFMSPRVIDGICKASGALLIAGGAFFAYEIIKG